MRHAEHSPKPKSTRSSLGMSVIQAFSVASQMAMLHAPIPEEWIREELGGSRRRHQ